MITSARAQASEARFDFVMVPILDESGTTPSGQPELILPESRWVPCVAGRVSDWIDLDSRDRALRRRSEIAFQVRRVQARELTHIA